MKRFRASPSTASQENTPSDFLQESGQNQTIGSTQYTSNYTYNYAKELSQVTYPSGRVVLQSFDAIGRLCAVGASGSTCSSGTTYISGFNYNSAFQVTGLTYGNGVAATFNFSVDRLQLSSLSYTKSSTTLFSLNYSYGTSGSNNGQIAGITDNVDNGRSATYIYDALYRLSNAATTGSTNYPAWGLGMTYDRYGNRTQQQASSGCTGITCPQPIVLVSTTTNRITGSPYSYDASGNMTNDGLNTLVYDGENRATSATNGSSAGAYVYDGNGIRIKKCVPNCTSPTTTTIYIFSGSKVIAEYVNGAAPSTPTREYVYSGGTLIAKIEAGATKYYHQDHLSNRLVTDSTGAKVEETGHFPFGESWYNASNDKLIFTTYERDPESGNDYAMARSDSSGLARFLEFDPIEGEGNDPQSWNRYTYALNDPCNLADPLGLKPKKPCRFKIAIYPGSLSNKQLQALQKSLAAVFATAGVGVDFNFSGDPDYSLSVVPSGTSAFGLGGQSQADPQAFGSDVQQKTDGANALANRGQLYFDRPMAFYGLPVSSPTIGTVLGRAGAHEAGHYLLNMIHNPAGISGMGKNTPFGWIMDEKVDTLKPHLAFTPGQTIQLQDKCKSLRAGGGNGNDADGQWVFWQPIVYGMGEGEWGYGPGQWIWWPGGGIRRGMPLN